MKGKPWRAALFDWQFNERGIRLERGEFVKLVKKLNFNIYPSDDVKGIKETRNLSKTDFLKELQRCACDRKINHLLQPSALHGPLHHFHER